MPNLTLTIGSLIITPLVFALFLAFVFSSFSFWRRMIKDDFPEEDIFSTSILLFLGGLCFEILFNKMLGIKIMGAFLGFFLVSLWRFKTIGLNFWEGLDHLSLSIIYFFFFGGLGSFLTNNNLFFLGYSLTALIGEGIYLFLKNRYRRFFWYKSGKTGFLFWSLCFYFSSVLLVLDFWQNKRLYWTEVFWLALILISTGAIYFRAELNKK